MVKVLSILVLLVGCNLPPSYIDGKVIAVNTVAPYETTKKFDGFLAGGITTVTIPETYYAIVQTDSLGLFKVQTEWLMVIGDQLSAKVHMNKWRAIHSDESRANHWNTDG